MIAERPLVAIDPEKAPEDSENVLAEEDVENSTPAEVPEELTDLVGQFFATEQELQDRLEVLGIGDLPIELDTDGKAVLKRPSDEHNKVTSWLTSRFIFWTKGRWGYATPTNTVKLNNHKTRLPDVSFWGYPRCEWFDGHLFADLGKVEPDVVIQFSWKNEWDYDVKAINDMMNRSSAGDGNAVRIGYLIKMDFTVNGKNNPPTGLDIYKVPRGTTIADAIANANGAQHIVYTPGRGQDAPIVITASDLGVTGFWAYFLGSFKISARLLWELLL